MDVDRPQREQLPRLPQPATPDAPSCDWCGVRPALPYEVAPPILSTQKKSGPNGETQTVKLVKKRATMAYACQSHRERFDQRKAEAEEARRKAAEERKRKNAERKARRAQMP